MNNLFYLIPGTYSSSYTGSNFLVSGIYNTESKITNLIVCSSLYEILTFSGSTLIAAFPIEGSNIFYYSGSFPENIFFPTESTPTPTTSSLQSASADFFTTSSLINTQNDVVWEFFPNTNLTSSDDVFIITGSTIIFPFTESQIDIIQSQSYNIGFFQFSGSVVNITVSGSGLNYTSSLLIYNATSNVTVSYDESYGNYLTSSFTSSLQTTTYNITAKTNSTPGIQLVFNNISNIPVSPTNSLDNWNSYLQISASSISNNGSTVSLFGGTLADQTLLSIGDKSLTQCSFYGLENLTTFYIFTGSLSSPPIFVNSPNMIYYEIYNTSLTGSNIGNFNSLYTLSLPSNKLSGNIQNIIDNNLPLLEVLNCSNNLLTGSIPHLSQSQYIVGFNCSNNRLSGSIEGFNDDLFNFNCSNNSLTGSIPSVDNCIVLQYFDCSNNKLSGSIPNFVSSSFLQYLDCSNNRLSGSIPTLPSSSLLSYFKVNNNRLTGNVPFFTSSIYTSPSIDVDVSNNLLTGSINFTGSTNLRNFSAAYNQLSGSIESLSGCSGLYGFNVQYNNLTGSLPDISNNPELAVLDVSNNKLSGNLPDFTTCPNLLGVDCSNNLLSGSIPDLNINTQLQTFVASNNFLTGSIPYLYNTSLNYFDCSNNNLDDFPDYTPFFVGVPATLTLFSLAGNNLTTSSANNIANAFYTTFSGSTIPFGIIDISGGMNAPPDAGARQQLDELTGSGWFVFTN